MCLSLVRVRQAHPRLVRFTQNVLKNGFVKTFIELINYQMFAGNLHIWCLYRRNYSGIIKNMLNNDIIISISQLDKTK